MAKKDCKKHEVCKELSDEVLEQVTGGMDVCLNGTPMLSGTPEQIAQQLENYGFTLNGSQEEIDSLIKALIDSGILQINSQNNP